MREYEEPTGIPDDAVPLDPDAARAAELADAQVPDEEIDELFRVSDEMRTTVGVMLQIVRVLPVKDAGFVGEMAPSEFTLERMRQQFGTGKYRVRVMGPKGYVPGGGSVTIATVPEKPIAPQSSVADVLAILKQDKEESGAKLKEWAQILTPLLVPVVAGLFSQKNQVAEMVQGLAALKELTPAPKEPPDFNKQFDNILALTEKLKTLAGENQSTTGATWIDLIRDGISSLKPLVETVATRALGGPGMGTVMPNPIQLPAPSPAPILSPGIDAASAGAPAASPSNGEVKPVGVMSLLPWLSATLQQLIFQAARNKDPELYAEVTLDNVPDGVDVKALIPFLERADWWEQLKGFAPAVAPYPAWFADYREALLTILKEDAKPEPPADPGPGDDTPTLYEEPHSGDGM